MLGFKPLGSFGGAIVTAYLLWFITQMPVGLARMKFLECGSGHAFGCLTTIPEKFSIQREFDHINDQLESTVNSESVEANMAAIDGWITQEAKRHLAPGPNNHDSERLEALTLFRELDLHDAPTITCTESTYTTLLENNRAMRDVFKKHINRPMWIPRRRIERILLHLAQKHSEECKRHYLEKYQQAIKEIKEEDLNRVRRFVAELIKLHVNDRKEVLTRAHVSNAEQFLHERPLRASRFVNSITSFSNKRDCKRAYKMMNEFIPDDGTENRVNVLASINIDRRASFRDILNLGNLFHKYLTQPCIEFATKFKEAFDRDLAIFKTEKLDPKDVLWMQFFRDLTLYRGCQVFKKSAVGVANGVNKLILSSGKAFKFK